MYCHYIVGPKGVSCGNCYRLQCIECMKEKPDAYCCENSEIVDFCGFNDQTQKYFFDKIREPLVEKIRFKCLNNLIQFKEFLMFL